MSLTIDNNLQRKRRTELYRDYSFFFFVSDWNSINSCNLIGLCEREVFLQSGNVLGGGGGLVGGRCSCGLQNNGERFIAVCSCVIRKDYSMYISSNF